MEKVNVIVPLELSLIDEGRFVGDMNKALAALQEALVKHVKKYGHKAKRAKAQVKAEITLLCLEPEQQSYACGAALKLVLPSAPPAVTMLMGGETQTGEDCLLCRKSGSSKDHPAQLKLATEDGRNIDTATGEVLDAMEN